MAEQVLLSFVSAFFMRCSETPRHLMIERDAHANGAKNRHSGKETCRYRTGSNRFWW
jgi:hypothetical protein